MKNERKRLILVEFLQLVWCLEESSKHLDDSLGRIFQTTNKLQKLNQNKISLFLSFFIIYLMFKCRFVA